MATLTECPDCGKHYRSDRCECGFSMPKRHATPVTEVPDWTKRPQPCTPEQNEYAHNLVWAVVSNEITVEQAKRVLNELFLGRELEL